MYIIFYFYNLKMWSRILLPSNVNTVILPKLVSTIHLSSTAVRESTTSILRFASTTTTAARNEGSMNELYMKALEPKPPAEYVKWYYTF